MSECIISRRGSSSGGTSGGNMTSEVIIKNTVWVVPNHIGNISVRIFGGGGGGNGSESTYGGGGWMNNGEFNINTGSTIPIYIGHSGNIGNSGGTTSFGTYLSAAGGTAGTTTSGGSGGSGGGAFGSPYGGRGFQFGGGGVHVILRNNCRNSQAGAGGIWGGGGGCYIQSVEIRSVSANGGNGGTYGGGGGLYCMSSNISWFGGFSGTLGVGGTYGGNGGYNVYGKTNISAENGTNTMSNISVPENCRGWGRNGSCGGGGYGGNGGAWGGG